MELNCKSWKCTQLRWSHLMGLRDATYLQLRRIQRVRSSCYCVKNLKDRESFGQLIRKEDSWRCHATVYRMTDVDKEIAGLSLPALASLAADPIAGLVDTAYLGRLGAVELAAVGVALSVFNTVTKICNVPLLAVTTSLVATAEGGTSSVSEQETGEASSAAILIALVVGLFQASLLVLFAASILSAWGAGPASATHADALAFLRIKALGSPVTVLLLVLQGIFRGTGDTRTPLKATIVANVLNIALAPLFIFGFGWGAPGAASATVTAQGIAVLQLLVTLKSQMRLSVGGRESFTRAASFVGPTGLLALRSIAISGTFAVATSMAARTDSIHTAAHQICLQIWLASSLLADALAVAAQTLTARNLAADKGMEAQYVADRVVKLGILLGLLTMAGLALGTHTLPRLFTPSPDILAAISIVFPWVVLTQPITALAFVWDGVLFGVSGFKYAATAMVGCAIPSVSLMYLAAFSYGNTNLQLSYVWSGLGLIMALRAAVIYLPYKLRRSPFDKLFAHKSN